VLVLSRKKDQEVCLPDLGIKFKVLQIKGNTVRLGIDAPDDVHVLRGELNEFREMSPREITIPFENHEQFERQFA
jgi:carbon storage regulator